MSKNNYYSDDLTIQASQGYLYEWLNAVEIE